MNGEERFGKLKYGTRAAERRKEEDDNRNVTRKILVPTSKRGENGLTVKSRNLNFPNNKSQDEKKSLLVWEIEVFVRSPQTKMRTN